MKQKEQMVGAFNLLLWAASLIPWTWNQQIVHPELDQIEIGMTLKEVEHVMGRPDDKVSLMFAVGVSSPAGLSTRMWLFEDGCVCIDVSGDIVNDKWFVPLSKPTVTERTQSWVSCWQGAAMQRRR